MAAIGLQGELFPGSHELQAQDLEIQALPNEIHQAMEKLFPGEGHRQGLAQAPHPAEILRVLLAEFLLDLAQVGHELAVAQGQTASLQGPGYHGLEIFQTYLRLQQIVIGPQAQGLDGAVQAGVPGEDDDLGLGEFGLDPGEQLQAGKAGQPYIQQGQVEFFLLEGLQGLQTVGQGAHRISLLPQKFAEHAQHQGLIVRQEDRFFLGHHCQPSVEIRLSRWKLSSSALG